MSATSERRVFDAADPDVNVYRLLTAVVVPRPIAWVSTLSGDGRGNLAPHSFFTVACARPPVVQFTSVGSKDTLRNARETGEFVVNLVSRPLLEAANGTSAPFDHGVDEAEALGVEMEPSEQVRPPRVRRSPASIECRLHSTIELGDSTLVLGDVVAITVRAEALEGDHPAIAALEPVSRLGRDEWGLPPQVLRVPRPRRPEDVTGR
ncbi:flavin reductase family protein [Nocardioides pantholopis]|uniref:flavin reductase family protein n=1 Tax=Nocardioides pantholopis TaxID=2483798 RepID=UPI000F07E960|nr:flavin reductase family protein [Nocardioides pantholopis]